ncbi:hypothetical protein EBR21_07355 [bacterium]|nr:hypothetical protein [bacterium]
MVFLYLVLSEISLPSATAFAHGGRPTWFFNIGPNIGAIAKSKRNDWLFNHGIEGSMVYLYDDQLFFLNPWLGVFGDWSKGNGFGNGFEFVLQNFARSNNS